MCYIYIDEKEVARLIEIAGSCNWKLIIRREETQIVILQAVTCETRAQLPETLFDLPVRVLADHALAPGAARPEGEEVLLTCGPTEGLEWDNLHLVELTLPESLRQVGNYALFNCSALHTLHLHDTLLHWGGGALMNCQNLRQFIIGCSGHEGEVLYYLADELPFEMDITLKRPDSTVRLLLPEYFESYDENCPAHIFSFHIYGAGYAYHHCFYQRRLSLTAYDRLWNDLLSTKIEDDCPLRIAWYRLRYPVELSPGAAAAYGTYLQDNRMAAARWLLAEQDTEGLRFLLDFAAWEKDDLSQLCSLAREKKQNEALALLLEQQHRSFPVGLDKDFDL